MRKVEYLLITAFVGAVTMGLGTMVRPLVANLIASFMQIAQALQPKP